MHFPLPSMHVMFVAFLRTDLNCGIRWREVASAQKKDHGDADGKPLSWEEFLHQLVNSFSRASNRACLRAHAFIQVQ